MTSELTIAACLYCAALIERCPLGDECGWSGWIHHANNSHYCYGKPGREATPA